jgi:DNA-binding MarR family transcriptional regulator
MSYSNKGSVKDRLVNYFFNPVYNTLTVKQASARFGITASTVTKAVNELRKEGFAIYTNRKTLEDGRKISVYRLGSASKRYLRNLRAGRTRLAVQALTGRAA